MGSSGPQDVASRSKDIQALSHPLDPLSVSEILSAVSVVRQHHGNVDFNTVTLLEPPKSRLLKWIAQPKDENLPQRQADVVAIDRDGKVFDGHVDLTTGKIVSWEHTEDVQPLLTLEDLGGVEEALRKDAGVIEQCRLVGVNDMSKVYCDAWAIGYDERYGTEHRLQQALMYYRPHIDDTQYTYPLDFCPIFDARAKKVIHIDIPDVRRPVNTAPPTNYHIPAIEAEGGFRKDLKALEITQPDGVSFDIRGRTVTWQNWSIHVGFNHREGIVLSDISFFDKDQDGGKLRSLFYRLSLAEMVVPYGHPGFPHHRKHAFDLGEYGAGYLTNPLTLGCDCKGAIHYMDAHFVTKAGSTSTVRNAICIHEEDNGILFKHTDFRDGSTLTTRARKLIISQIFTAGNYEYCIYWIFHQDGTIQLEVRLTGILSTYAMYAGEETGGWGTEVYPGVHAHNHQHLFCLRIDPQLDGQNNTVFQVDAVPSPAAVGSAENYYGNAFYAQKTKLETPLQAMCNYDGATSRTWEIVNENKLNPYSHKPVGFKLVSREVPGLLPKKGSLVWKRAGFARHDIHVTKYQDGQHFPAGRHVPQMSGDKDEGLPKWIAQDPHADVTDTDVVLWHTFGVTHFAAPEDYPLMPAEPMTLLLRPRNFFKRNPALDVVPSYGKAPSQIAAGVKGTDHHDKCSVEV